jgi:hypothetical protein
VSGLFRPVTYKALPAGCELFTRKRRDGADAPEQWARWTDRRGRTHTARVAVPKSGWHVGEPRLAVWGARWRTRR